MEKKGFTLVELLAVIIIIGIIALIATSVVGDVIKETKVKSAEDSVLGYVKAVENQTLTEMLKGNPLENGIYTTNDNSSLIKNAAYTGNRVIGEFTINDNEIVSGKFCVGNISVDYDGMYATYNEDANYCNPSYAYENTPIDEIIQDLLDDNNTYTYMDGTYLKGEQDKNYVWYNGFLWRIMGKNSDGTIRLITEENIAAIPWGTTNSAGLNTNGYIKDWLNTYFLGNLDNAKASIIQNENWCIEPAEEYESTRTTCALSNTVQYKVGLITIDEYHLSAIEEDYEVHSYLINGLEHMTLTLYGDSNMICVVSFSGYENNIGIDNASGVRPVINVSSSALVQAGDGTLNNAYILNQSPSSETGTINTIASSGNYVKLNNRLYRIVSKEEQGVKLVLDDFYDANNDNYIDAGVDGSSINSDSSKGNVFEDSTMKTFLNSNILSWLGNSNLIINGTWNQGEVYNWGNPYTLSLTNTVNNITSKVGLLRIGEILTGQSASVMTRNYTSRSDSSYARAYWTLTKNNNFYENWTVEGTGRLSTDGSANDRAVRPAIYVDNSTTVIEGNGTFQNPYIIQ